MSFALTVRALSVLLIVAVPGAANDAVDPARTYATVIPSCTKYAATWGRNSNPGSLLSPYRTAGRLANALAPGEVGCLTGGTFAGDVSIRRGGAPGRPTTLTTAPGMSSAICGRIEIRERADYVTLAGLTVDGSCSSENTIKVYSSAVVIRSNTITNRNRGRSCIFLGHRVYGYALAPIVDRNRIHDCGHGQEPHGHQTHGIYNGFSRNARITNNVIWGAQFYGIQFWPDADGGLFAYNVVDGSRNRSAVIIGGEEGFTSDNNTIRANVLTFNAHYGVVTLWEGVLPGTGNRVLDNCLWRNRFASWGRPSGLLRSGNLFANPLYVDRPARDYRLRRGSPCAGRGPR